MNNQYNIATHTILPLIYRIFGPHNHISYLLKEPSTRSLFMFNPLTNIANDKNYTNQTQNKYHAWLIDHINKIQQVSESKLTHVITNHNMYHKQYDQLIKKLGSSKKRQIKYLSPQLNTNNSLKPQVVGEVSICFVGAQGYTSDYNLIGVTHISPSSTKVPVLFVNNLIGVCTVDYQYDEEYTEKEKPRSDQGYLKSLNKVKYFPNQTYIFPSQIAQMHDLLFAKAIIGAEESTSKYGQLLNQKIKLYQKNSKNSADCLIPTTVMEQKYLNPFFNPQKFCKLLGVKKEQKSKCFGLLRSIRKQWKDNPTDE